jgi:hypothetical protein
MKRRIAIDRLDLDLRGIDPAVAEAAVRRLGPALREQLARPGGGIVPAADIDAGTVAPAADAQGLANGLAQRIAHSVRKG